VQGWFHAAGLKPGASEAIASGGDKLTVKVWLAQATAKAQAEAA
jgi:hypothetical protein